MFKKSFLYMFSDNKFFSKYLAIFIFIFLLLFIDGIFKSNYYSLDNIIGVVLLSIASFLIYAVIIGYRITNISALNITNEIITLPFLYLKYNFIKGLKFQLAILVFTLIATYFIGGFAFLTGLSIILLKDELIWYTFASLTIICTIIYVIYNLLFAIGFTNIYAKHPSYLKFFKIKFLLSSIKNAPKKYILSLLFYSVTILLAIFNLIISSTETIIFVLTVVVSSLIMTYLFFVNNYVIANCMNADKNTNS